MMNIFSIGNSIRSRIATVLTPRFSRLASLSIVSRQSDLRTYSAESSCETFSVGQSSPLAFPFKAKSQLAFSHQSVLPILLLFLSLFMGVGNAWGAKATFTASQFTSWTTSQASQSQTISGFTIATTSGMRDGGNAHLRLYSGATHTITSSVGNITQIVFTCTANGTNNYGPGKMSGTGYSASSGKTGTWTGNSSTVTLSGGQARVTQIEITYTPSASCTTEPTVTAGSNSSVTSTTATVSCSSGISVLGSAGCSISSYGFVIGTSANPSIGGTGVTKHEVGTSYTTTGTSFSKNLTSLSPEATYYVRPYATNGKGTSYGTQTSFTTPALPIYTVTLKDDNDTRTQASYGASVNLPSRAGCPDQGFTFAGWTKSWTSPQASWTTTAPTIVDAGSYTPTANENLYPVYTKTETGGGVSWVLSSSAPTVGDSIIIAYYTGAAYKYMKNSGCDNDVLTVSSNIATPVANAKFKVVAGASNGVSFQSGTNYMHLNSSALNVTSTQVNSDISIFAGSSTNSFIIKRHSNATTYDRVLRWTGTNWTSSATMGDACDIYFFKRSTSTTSYISVPDCCTPLGQINGAVTLGQLATPNPTQLKATWSMAAETGISSYTLKVYKSSNTSTPEKTINNYTSGSEITGLTPCTSYYVELYTESQGDPYCAGGLIGTSSAVETGSYSVDYSGCSDVTNDGEATTCAAADYSVTFAGSSARYAMPENVSVTIGGVAKTQGTHFTWKQGTGVLTIPKANITGNIVIVVEGVDQGACESTPVLGAASLSGAFSLTNVGVSCASITPGDYCDVTEYGFIWYEGTGNKEIGGDGVTKVTNEGEYTSGAFANTLTKNSFAAGTTYSFRAYATNSGGFTGYSAAATFKPYTVSYNANGGTGEVATVVVNAGGSVTLPNASAFSLDCNDLTKWALNSASGTQYNPEAPYSSISDNAVFYAIWNTRTYTVQYAAGTTPANGGAITGSHNNDTKTCGVALDLPGVTFSSTGYTQDGWATSDGGSKAKDLSGSYTDNAAQTFYPHWLINTYTIYKGSKTGCSGNDFTVASSVNHYGSITVTASPDAAHKGSPNVSIYPAANGSVDGTTISNITGDITVSVSFTAKETATVILHDATGAHTQTGPYYEADNYTLPNNAAACTESELYGWYTETYIDQPTAPSGAKYIAKNASKTLAAGDNHFYAVYATIDDRYTNTFTKITSVDDLTSGDYLIAGISAYCMSNTVNASNYMNESTMSSYLNEGVITNSSNNNIIWTITKDGDNYTLYNAAATGNKYLALTTTSPAMQAEPHNFTVALDGECWVFSSVATTGYVLGYYTYFKSLTAKSSNVLLYKRDKAPSAGAPYTTSPNCTTHDLTSAIDPSSPVSGTVDLGKTTILVGKTTTATATPSAHYTFSHWTISGTGAGLSNVDGEGKSTDNPVTVTMGTADAEITAHFTEKEKCTVEFYNNGGSALSSTTYWLGETPEAPTLTDGHDHDACDETSTTHYGWTQTAWTETLTQEQVDAKTAADVKVYAKAAALPAVAAGDNGKTIKYHAVWVKKETSGSEVTKTYGFEDADDASCWTITDAITKTSGQGATGSYAGKINTNNTYITFNDKVKVTNFSFKLKRTTDNSNYSAIIETSADGSNWSAAETYPLSGFGNGSYTSKSKDFDGETALYVRFHCSNTTAVRYVDDISITYDGVTTTYSAFLTNCAVYHSVSSAVSPEDKATVTLGANSVAEGSTTTAEYSGITAGYEFVNWTISGTGASLDDNTANPTTITMGTADVTVTANLQCITPSISVQPAASTTCLIGATPELSVTAAAGGASLNYQWQQCATIDGTYVNVASAGTSSTYSPSTAAEGTTYYKCIVTNAATGCSTSVTSDPATVTVNAPSGYCISLFNSNNNGIQSGFSNGGSGNEYTLDFTIPGKDGSSNWPQYWIGENNAWASYSVNANFADMKFTSSDGTLGLAEGATGTLHIWDDNKASESNLWVKFEPSGYGFRWGGAGEWDQAVNTKAFTVDANNANTYWTDLVTLDGTNNTAWSYYVGLQTASGYVYSGVDNEASDSRGISRTRSVTTMKVSNGTAGQYKETFLDSEATGTTGKFRIWNNNITDYNFVCHFVPFYQLKYNANGGSGTMNPLPATPVSCEESAANRTVTVAANTFTAPTGKQFVKWNTAANGSGADVATGAYELTGDVTLYAIWEDIDYSVTVNQSPDVSAETTGQTNAAHYGATINLTTTVPDGYEFVNWTSSDVTISNPTSEDGASFTMPAKNVIVTANFQQIYTITWSANGVTTTSTVNAGNKLVLPASDPTSCNAGYSTFIGWYSVAAGSAEEPSANVSGTKADANHTPTGNETWYAVWANGELVGGWQKATSIAVGDVVVFVYETATKELTGISSSVGTATAYSTTPAGTYPLTVMAGSANNSYAFKNGNNYISYSGTGNNLYTSTTLDAASSWTMSVSDGNFQFTNANSTTRIMQYNTSSPRWACYTGSQTAFQIYKQIPSATEFISGCCTDWSAPAISYSIPDHWKAGDGDVAVTIAPGTTHGAVSFESSDDDVLTVDAETGAIHAVAVGTATVTATWAGGVVDAVRYCTALSTSAEISVSGTVTITFNGNDATSGSMDNQVIYYNEATALSTNAFSRTGYTFYGWAETEQKADAGNRDYVNGESVTFTTNKTLYAAWHANKHKVTLNEPTGISIEATGAADLANVDYGTSITLSAEESDGYVFTGWSVTGITLADATANPAVFTMPDNDVTVTATYSTYEWIVADPRYSVTTDPKTSYYKVEKFSTAGVVIKENFKRSDDNTITKQETYSGAWTAKLDGTPIANGADLSLDDDGKTLKLYIGEVEIASYTLTVNNIDVDQFVVGIWDIEAPSFQINTYTMPTLSNQTAGDAATCKDHNIFIGWTTDPDDPKDANITAGGTEGIVASNTTYYAVWAKMGNVTKTLSYGWEDGESSTGLNITMTTSSTEGGARTGSKFASAADGKVVKTSSSYASPKSITYYIQKSTTNKNANNYFILQYSANGSNWTDIDETKRTLADLSQTEWTEISLDLSAETYQNKYFQVRFNTGGAPGSLDDYSFSYQTTGPTDYIVDCEARYEILFDANGATGSYDPIKKAADKTIELPSGSLLSKEYHNFAGWQIGATAYEAGDTYTVSGADAVENIITVTAQWTPFSQGTVTIDGETLEGSPFYATQSYTLPNRANTSDKKFIGWSDGETIVAPGEYTMPDPATNIIYTSQWFDLLPTPSGVSFTNGEWILVTAQDQLHAGDFIVVAAANADYAMGAEASGNNNRTVQAVTKSGNTLSYESDVQPLFLQNGYGANQYALYDMSADMYLYAASSSNNYLKIDTDFDQNGSWLITIANGSTSVMAQGANTHNDLRYNAGGSIINSVFSCYAEGGQQPIAIYKWIETIKTEGNVNASDVMPTYNVNLVVQTNTAIDMNVERTVNDFIIEAMEGHSGQVLNPNNLHINGNAYYDLTLNTNGAMDNSKWYAFAVPFQIDAATGIQRLSNDGVASTAQFNGHYVLLKYNSAERAKGNTGWQYVTAGEKLMPGRFYMVALNSNAYNRLRMTKDAGAAVNNLSGLDLSEYTDNGTADAGDKNWNALANNALAYANVSAEAPNASLKVQTYISATNAYDVFAYDEVTFTVGTPFFVQAAASGTMDVTIAASNNETVKAPKFYDLATEEFQIRLGADTESYYDKLYVSASEEALDEYQIGHDLAKAGVSTTVPQMYVPAYGSKLCDAEFPLVNNEAVFPLTFTTPTAGTYQLYVKKAAQDAKLYLLRDGNVIWDLTMSAYAIELPQGTTENYSLKIVATPKTPTGLENTEYGVQNTDVQKVIINDQVFILRGGQMYDVTGKMVK